MELYEQIELQECPICGGAGLMEEENGWCFYAACLDCGAHTAEIRYERDAERLSRSASRSIPPPMTAAPARRTGCCGRRRSCMRPDWQSRRLRPAHTGSRIFRTRRSCSSAFPTAGHTGCARFPPRRSASTCSSTAIAKSRRLRAAFFLRQSRLFWNGLPMRPFLTSGAQRRAISNSPVRAFPAWRQSAPSRLRAASRLFRA